MAEAYAQHARLHAYLLRQGPRKRLPRLHGWRSPSPCTSSSPNGAVGSVTSPSRRAKNRSCSSRETPSRARATKSRNGGGAGSVSASPCSRAVISLQRGRLAGPGPPAGDGSAAGPATAPCRARRHVDPYQRCPAQVHPRPGRGQQPARRIRAAGILVTVVQDNLGDRQPRMTPHHLHRFGQRFPGHRGPVDVVAIDQQLERAEKILQPGPGSNLSTIGRRYTSRLSAAAMR